jgi:hypothetical protein
LEPTEELDATCREPWRDLARMPLGGWFRLGTPMGFPIRVIGGKIRPREPEREMDNRTRFSVGPFVSESLFRARIAINSPSPRRFFRNTHTLLLKRSPSALWPHPYHPSTMPNTATRNIDAVLDGQLYIGKYVFSNLRNFVCNFSLHFH